MAEDDEIDILGDFNLDTLLTKNDSSVLVSQTADLLNCDYTIHPQWLLDKPSANPDCWYDSSSVPCGKSTDFSSNDLGLVSTENAITDESGWTEKEKNLLERGIEIFGKSPVRLAQFIGTRVPAEVKYYLKNFYLENQLNFNGFSSGVIDDVNRGLVADVLEDTQIPASIEQVIAVVSTAKTTIPVKSRKKNNSGDDEPVEDNTKVKKKKRRKAKFTIEAKLPAPLPKLLKQKTPISIVKSRVEITTGKGLSVPLCEGEEIVKIDKNDADSDIEIDVEDEDPKSIVPLSQLEPVAQKPSDNNYKPKLFIDVESLTADLKQILTSSEQPQYEQIITDNEITPLEKLIHSEFFEGRPTKTPLRYLKIRNHIINTWFALKPAYVTKTSIRQGLKNCGDVNCISRVHCYLEQLGIINFGCSQTSYARPLIEVFQAFSSSNREKSKENKHNGELQARSRHKRKFANDGDGGCTLTHDEKGAVINTTIVSEDPKPKSIIKKPAISLIYCRSFPPGSAQKYKVKLDLMTLLLMDLHAHSSRTEIMGLVAGTWNPLKKTLTISHYEPCKNLASSATHCDMCPISQARSAELIHGRNMDVLGWFHSHPTFAPEPSQQDLETQRNLQLGLGARSPCLGVILSPFSSHGALIASPFRCMMVEKKVNFEDQFVPYKFHVDIISNEEEIAPFFENVERMPIAIDFNKPYFMNSAITHLEKYITSVRMHLAKCGTLNKMTCDYIIEKITRIYSK